MGRWMFEIYAVCYQRSKCCVQAVLSYDCGLWHTFVKSMMGYSVMLCTRQMQRIVITWCKLFQMINIAPSNYSWYFHPSDLERWKKEEWLVFWIPTALAAACLHWSSSAQPQHTLNLCLNDAELIDLRWQSTFFRFSPKGDYQIDVSTDKSQINWAFFSNKLYKNGDCLTLKFLKGLIKLFRKVWKCNPARHSDFNCEILLIHFANGQ